MNNAILNAGNEFSRSLKTALIGPIICGAKEEAVKNFKLCALLALLVVAAACGGGGGIMGPSPSPSPTPSAPARVVVRQLTAEFGPNIGGVAWQFTVEQSGTLDVWFEVNPGPPQAYAEINLIAGTLAECNATPGCPGRLIVVHDPSLARQSLQFHVTPGTYTVRIFKNGVPAANGHGEIGLTPGA